MRDVMHKFGWITALIVALITVAATASAQAPVTIRNFFDDTQVQNIYLTVNPNDWATLQQNYLYDDYYQATFGLGTDST